MVSRRLPTRFIESETNKGLYGGPYIFNIEKGNLMTAKEFIINFNSFLSKKQFNVKTLVIKNKTIVYQNEGIEVLNK